MKKKLLIGVIFCMLGLGALAKFAFDYFSPSLASMNHHSTEPGNNRSTAGFSLKKGDIISININNSKKEGQLIVSILGTNTEVVETYNSEGISTSTFTAPLSGKYEVVVEGKQYAGRYQVNVQKVN